MEQQQEIIEIHQYLQENRMEQVLDLKIIKVMLMHFIIKKQQKRMKI